MRFRLKGIRIASVPRQVAKEVARLLALSRDKVLKSSLLIRKKLMSQRHLIVLPLVKLLHYALQTLCKRLSERFDVELHPRYLRLLSRV